MARTFRMWSREDGGEPKALAADAKAGPGPGRVFSVEARSTDEARGLLKLVLGAEPDKRANRALWNEWDEARERVVEVIS